MGFLKGFLFLGLGGHKPGNSGINVVKFEKLSNFQGKLMGEI